MDGVRVGNKKPSISVSKAQPTFGKHGNCCEDTSKHVVKNLGTTTGEGVHGMPLFSAASKSAGD